MISMGSSLMSDENELIPDHLELENDAGDAVGDALNYKTPDARDVQLAQVVDARDALVVEDAQGQDAQGAYYDRYKNQQQQHLMSPSIIPNEVMTTNTRKSSGPSPPRGI